ncbi:(2E,6E)-farnesyl diphosphate synthase [Bermanella marisrubri]|uniref:Polyprenyl synthetase n=1 Tax=Bermanella marisrubri TaxID=207949 RepID=Q1N246_9GAMM|nr:farnesyl diphosphate synthase [Bermanella marisrubri]EAT12318.1 Polyprenyl synthetase [Bermanella marisrubri]QIZ85406.1 (2E,6E)-farnesyl diphosphate synthase [Bermanella marisrubri]
MTFQEFQTWSQDRFQSILKADYVLPNVDAQRLKDAMTYSLLNGGKRVRPLMVYATTRSLSGDLQAADQCALAVEMIHAYSLVHDDLPAMDDDELRRGQPTCHIAFDEATAILAGDALQTQAFQVLVQPIDGMAPQQQLRMVQTLAHASGLAGMAGGQSLDLEAVDKQVDIEYLQNMHLHKTGALIEASVKLGGLCANASEQQLSYLSVYAQAIGLAFQVQDDILDVISDTRTLGKPQGSDESRNKPTYVSLLGLDGAKRKAQDLHQQARDALRKLDADTSPLEDIARYIIERTY